MLEKCALEIAIAGHERACVRWALSVGEDEQSRIYADQVVPCREAIKVILQSKEEGEGR